ncbi:hypothetical protein [Streptomyces sviceus]|uniref:hypothetical protein n=1 Tax=Streptomyces sviceus TaxID=285530 RepID=UPI003D9F99AB
MAALLIGHRSGNSSREPARLLRRGFTGRMGDAEYDHLISLQLGGDPNDYRTF